MRKEFEKKVQKQSENTFSHPEKGTKRYAQNEKIINENMALKKARDISQGIEKGDSAYSHDSHGKGSATRGNSAEYKANFDKIDFSKSKSTTKKGWRVKINGVYVDE
jgi:hypothetical protein